MSQSPEKEPEPPRQQGVSLDELAEAYAEAMGSQGLAQAEPADEPEETAGLESSPEPEAEAAVATAEAPPSPAESPDGDDACPVSPKTILEAMLFVGNQDNEPLSSTQAAELMRGVSAGEIPDLVDELNRRYTASGCPYRVVSEGAGYRIALRKKFHPLRNRFYGRVREARLSQAALDVLAIVAYRQPIVADEVSRLRGTPTGHILAQLVRRQLLRIQRPAGKRRPVYYHTTDRFLGLFGLESLQDLPECEELENR